MASTNEAKAAAPGERGCQYERLPSPHLPGQGYSSHAAGSKGEDADSNVATVASKPLLRINSMASCPSGALPPGCAQEFLHGVGATGQELAGTGMRKRGRFAACVVTRNSALSVNLPWLGFPVADGSPCLLDHRCHITVRTASCMLEVNFAHVVHHCALRLVPATLFQL